MKLDDILSHDARNRLRDHLIEDYLDEASTFLATVFADDPMLADATTRRDLARACLDHAQRLGIRRRNQHLDYAALAVRCGIGLEWNPLFRHHLDRAGWLDGQGQLTHVPDTGALGPFAAQWCQMAVLECQMPDVALSACLEAAERGGVAGRAPLLALLHAAWPDRTAIVPPRDLEAFADLVLDNITRRQMPDDVAALFAVLSLHLGAFFFRDPRYTGLIDAFADQQAGDEARSRAAARVIRVIWDGAATQQGDGLEGEGRHG
ncbi:MAG: hypothetical protein Q4G25_15365 [Paracoccus sp. (in: a-proteobacteria)]|nr:hypothetical protein [Paracoccus sp. (in: a-proteobacteria)]